MQETPLNGSQIGKELGISRQAVSYSIRKSMKKMYNYVLENKLADNPFDAVLALMSILGVNEGNIDDINSFMGLFDKEIQKDIENDAIKIYGKKV